VGIRETLGRWTARAKAEFLILRRIARHPRAPRSVKWLAGALAAYALSPIDLIPDFIPILGHLDEAILLPLGIYLIFKLTPPDVIEDCRRVSA
jgi:uncharacterized membrane protein YkvA (DUF1232 family)